MANFGTEAVPWLIPLIRALIFPFIAYFLLNYFFNVMERAMLKKAKTKKQITNIELFHKMGQYILVIILLVVAALSYTGSWKGFGISVGVLSVIIAWTLMKPLLGIVAWITLVIKRPFAIGDRIKIADITGDVIDITLTHIYISETGGRVHGSEDKSGSTVIVPNAAVFEQPIINYTDKDNYLLDEVAFTITYTSDIDEASKIALESARVVLKKEIPGYNKNIFIRTFFHEKGLGVHVRFFALTSGLGQYSSDIAYLIMKRIKKSRKVKLCDSGTASRKI